MSTQPIKLDLKPTPTGPTCPVCGDRLHWEGPGLWGCNVCQMAVDGTTIEEVREEIASSARSFTAMMDGTLPTLRLSDGSGIVHMEPPEDAPPHFDWAPVNEDQRAWQDEATAHQRKMVAEKRAAREANPTPCPICVRQQRHPDNVGRYVSKSPGGTEVWSCGHAIGK